MTETFTLKTLKKAAELLQSGELIAFPTETVFGLGAIANNAEAVKKVYEVKGRPSDNPLIVHISYPEAIFNFAELTEEQKQLINQIIKAFWPGPLTLVVPVKPGIFPDVVTGGLNTVGIRLPNHRFTQKLITETGFPLVGPSANKSGKPSPTSVDHVLHDFDGEIAGVLDSEPSQIGVESTVLDVSDPHHVQILRPGYVTREMLESAIPNLRISQVSLTDLETSERPKSPGMKYRHYSPNQPVIAIEKDQLLDYVKHHTDEQIGVAANDKLLENLPDNCHTFKLGNDIQSAMHHLFEALRYFDSNPEIDKIVVELYPDASENGAYRNRLLKASSQTIEK